MFFDNSTSHWQFIAKLTILWALATKYVSAFQYLMVAAIFIRGFSNIQFGIIIFCGGMILLSILTIIDWFKIYPYTLEIAAQKNPEWVKLMKMQEENKK